VRASSCHAVVTRPTRLPVWSLAAPVAAFLVRNSFTRKECKCTEPNRSTSRRRQATGRSGTYVTRGKKNVVRPYESWTTNAGNRKCMRDVDPSPAADRYGDGPANCRDERTTDRPTGAVTDETVGVTNHGAVCVSRPARLRDESEPRDRAPNPRFQPHTTTNDKKKTHTITRQSPHSLIDWFTLTAATFGWDAPHQSERHFSGSSATRSVLVAYSSAWTAFAGSLSIRHHNH
jgi:hypothetical protein